MELLMNEHEIIMKTEIIIDQIDGLWQTDERKYIATVNQIVDFLIEYCDHFHHLKEEECLFPTLNNHPDFLLSEIIDELEEHHQSFRDYIVEIKEYVQLKNWEQVQKTLKRYINELLDHIAVENDELFSIAENLFTPDELEKMYFNFMDIDMEHGNEKKQTLANNLEAMLNE